MRLSARTGSAQSRADELEPVRAGHLNVAVLEGTGATVIDQATQEASGNPGRQLDA
jgi:hypothetical protein